VAAEQPVLSPGPLFLLRARGSDGHDQRSLGLEKQDNNDLQMIPWSALTSLLVETLRTAVIWDHTRSPVPCPHQTAETQSKRDFFTSEPRSANFLKSNDPVSSDLA
jgi:hypothetical protein